MISIKKIQKKALLRLYGHLTKTGEKASTDDISIITGDLSRMAITTPLQGRYRVSGYESIDIKSLNAELGLVRTDAESTLTYLTRCIEDIDNASFVSFVTSQRAMSIARRLENDFLCLVGGEYITGLTEMIDIPSMNNVTESTAIVTEEGTIVPRVTSSEDRAYEYSDRDISVTPINGDNCTSSIYGSVYSLIDPASTKTVTMSLSGTPKTSETGFEIRVKTDLDDVNTIIIDFGITQPDAIVRVKGSANRVDYLTLYDGNITNRRIYVKYDRTARLKEIRVYLTRTLPNILSSGMRMYEFKITSITPMLMSSEKSSVFITKRIDVGTAKECGIYIDSVLAGNASVMCEVSTRETGGLPEGFKIVSEGEIISFDSDVIKVTAKRPESQSGSARTQVNWDNLPTVDTEKRLYNLLYVPTGAVEGDCVEISGDGCSLSGNALVFSSGVTPVYDRCRCYRGCGDYLVTRNETTRDVSASIRMSLPFPGISRDRIPLPILVTIPLKQSMIAIDSEISNATRITIPYRIVSTSVLEIIRWDGYTIKPAVLDVSASDSSSTITISYILDGSVAYSVRTAVSLATYSSKEITAMDVDQGTVSAIRDNGQSVGNISYDGESLSISLRGGDDISDMIISYSAKETRTGPVPVYSMYVYAQTTENIKILPFTMFEMSKGNYHSIDGHDCSRMDTFQVGKGFHLIKTTQPYPDYTSVNPLTGEQSNAGIIIPEGIVLRRPYLDPMRLVSGFAIQTMPESDASKVFSFDTTGHLVTGFRPDDTPSTDPLVNGSYFSCRRPVLQGEYNMITNMYRSPEKIVLEIPVIRSEIDSRFIYIKLTLLQPDDGKSSVTIRGIGLNKILQ